MKVGLVVPGFSAHEADWCIPALQHLVRRLAARHEVHVVALRYPYQAATYGLFGAEVTAIGGGTSRGAGSAAVWREAGRVLLASHRRRPFAVLHAFWANETGALAALLGRLLRVPTVVSLAGGELVVFRDIAYGGQLTGVERLKARIALGLATSVTAGSLYMLRQAAPWLRSRSQAQTHCIPLGVDTSIFHPSPVREAESPTHLVHIASLVPIKSQSDLLQALALLSARGTSCSLDVVGRGPLEGELRAMAVGLGLREKVRFRGEVDHAGLPAFYQRASLFVLSSRHEAQCLAALESCACGVPVVGTAVGVIPELAPEAAIAVPVGDVIALAEGVAAVVSSPERHAALARAAEARVAVEYSLDVSANSFADLYVRLADSQRGP